MKVCNLCRKSLIGSENDIILGKYYCHACLVDEHIRINKELTNLKRNYNTSNKTNELCKSVESLIEGVNKYSSDIVNTCNIELERIKNDMSSL